MDCRLLRSPTSHSPNLLVQWNVRHHSAGFVPSSLHVSVLSSRLPRPVLMPPVLGSIVDVVARRMVDHDMGKPLVVIPIMATTGSTRCIVSDTFYTRHFDFSSFQLFWVSLVV